MVLPKELEQFLLTLDAILGRRLQPRELLQAFRLVRSADSILLQELLNHVADEALRLGDNETRISALTELTSVMPDAISFVALANSLASLRTPQDAAAIFDVALDVAYREQQFVRYATIAKLRWCIEMSNAQAADETLRRFFAHVDSGAVDAPDRAIELDVVPQLRAMAVDQSLLDRLVALAAAEKARP